MSTTYWKYKSRSHDGNGCNSRCSIRMISNGSNSTDNSTYIIDDYLSMESIQKSWTSRMRNLHPILQSIPYVQTWRTIWMEFSMDLDTTGILCINDHKLFQNCNKILKTLGVWTWTSIYQNHFHTNPRIRQFKIS